MIKKVKKYLKLYAEIVKKYSNSSIWGRKLSLLRPSSIN